MVTFDVEIALGQVNWIIQDVDKSTLVTQINRFICGLLTDPSEYEVVLGRLKLDKVEIRRARDTGGKLYGLRLWYLNGSRR